MHNSFDDFIKLARNTTDEPIKISKEIVVTAQLKKECDARAMKIVEFSIQGRLRPELFTKCCLPFINQSHYQDIVEERAVTKLCGYTLCGKRIPDMPKKQYFISTKSNKVYDITERKNFCSNFCYKASIHLKKQLDNSPLWLRKLEDIPEYTLLHSSEGGLPGEYIDQGVVKPAKDNQFTSINLFAEASLGDMAENKPKKTGGFKKSSRLKSTMQTIKENVVEEEITTNDTAKTKRTVKSKKVTHKKNCIVSLPSIEENEEKLNCECKDVKQERLETNTSIPTKTEPLSINVESIIRKALDDWLTLETCIFLHGEEKVKHILTENKLSSYFDELQVAELQREQQMRYMDICRRLKLQEMADDKFDNAFVGSGKLKPLPDFWKLKEEAADMKIKVKSFYQGTMYEQNDKNFPAKINKRPEEEEEAPAVLPPVDVNSQKLMRRRIFLNSLNRAIQKLLTGLGASYSSILSNLQPLVKTFNLKANNITFKPPVWVYIAVVLLKLLSLKDDSIKQLLEEERSKEYITMLVEDLPSKSQFVPDVLKSAMDVEVFVQRHITKKDNV